MRLFPSTLPLKFVAIDILDELIQTLRRDQYLLVTFDRFIKQVRAIPRPSITSKTVARALATHWVLVYGPPKWFLSDNRKQFIGRFFPHICFIMGIENLFINTYYLQTSGQVECLNRRILAGIRRHLQNHPKNCDLFTDLLTFGYNTQVH